MRIHYTAPQHVRDVIAASGRTEDVKFSPGNKRLALASYSKNKVAVFDIDIGESSNGIQIDITGVAEIHSKHFKNPHGLDFIDDETFIVSNRRGDVQIFKLSAAKLENNRYELEPLGIIGSDHGLDAPGSLSVAHKDRNVYEVLICNNDGNSITRHLLNSGTNCSVARDEVLLKKWLDIPDGICVSTNGRWIAVSNHKMHSVLVYENNQALNEASDPDCILRQVFFPHGVRFTADGHYLVVADAGAPYVHVYRREGPSWRGVSNPLASYRVMSEEVFLRGRNNPMEGGPKGVDINNAANVLVTTNECQNLAFFDLAKILETASSQRVSGFGSQLLIEEGHGDPDAFALDYELHVQREAYERRNAIDARIARLTNSSSWRLTAPLRSLISAVLSVTRRARSKRRQSAQAR
jgi:hypothetical protein